MCLDSGLVDFLTVEQPTVGIYLCFAYVYADLFPFYSVCVLSVKKYIPTNVSCCFLCKKNIRLLRLYFNYLTFVSVCKMGLDLITSFIYSIMTFMTIMTIITTIQSNRRPSWPRHQTLFTQVSLQTCPCGAHAGFLRAQWARANPHQT